ncbi:MAG: SpoIIE family protein phosphatase [Candidatus Brocadiia bacterium]
MAEIADKFKQQCSYSPDIMVGALVDSMPYPVIVRDMEYRIVLANRASKQFYAGDLLRCKCYEASGLKECLCEDCPAREAVETGRPVEREVRHPETGDYLIIGVYPMYEPDGAACGIIETVRDVTEDRRREDKIRSLLSQVTRTNRELTRWRRSFQYELKVAREVQERLVPTAPVCVEGICFDVLYRPSGEVGGDLFDVLPLDEGKVAMLIADAAGHGVGAGLVAVMVRMVARSFGVDKTAPATMLKTMNDELVDIVPPGQFATGFYAVCTPDERRMSYAAAGHPAPILLRRGAEEAECLEEGGLPLGSLKEATFEPGELEFGPGDKLLLYTDGVLDAANADGKRFGADRLAEAVVRHGKLSGPDFLEAVVGAIEEFADGDPGGDDITIGLVESVRDTEREQRWGESGG